MPGAPTWQQRFDAATPPRLREGERVRYRGEVWRVERVTEAQALLVPEKRVPVAIVRGGGVTVEFERQGRGVGVSTHSLLERVP